MPPENILRCDRLARAFLRRALGIATIEHIIICFCEQRTQRSVSVFRPNAPYISPYIEHIISCHSLWRDLTLWYVTLCHTALCTLPSSKSLCRAPTWCKRSRTQTTDIIASPDRRACVCVCVCMCVCMCICIYIYIYIYIHIHIIIVIIMLLLLLHGHRSHCITLLHMRSRRRNTCLHLALCACHPCAGAMLLVSVSFQV